MSEFTVAECTAALIAKGQKFIRTQGCKNGVNYVIALNYVPDRYEQAKTVGTPLANDLLSRLTPDQRNLLATTGKSRKPKYQPRERCVA